MICSLQKYTPDSDHINVLPWRTMQVPANDKIIGIWGKWRNKITKSIVSRQVILCAIGFKLRCRIEALVTPRQAFKWDVKYKRASNKQVTLGLQRSLKRDTAYLNPIRPVLQLIKGILYIGKLTNGSNAVFPKVSSNASSIRNMKKDHTKIL